MAMTPEKLQQLADLMNKIVNTDPIANERYLIFLKKNHLTSGPTPEFIGSLTTAQRLELSKVFNP